MSLTTASTLRVVLYEGADAQPLDSTDCFSARAGLLCPKLAAILHS